MNTEIIGTISETGLFDSDFSIMENAMELGIHYFRINLSKYRRQEDLYRITSQLMLIKTKYKDDISFMLDLPIPRTKLRIYFDQKELNVKKGDLLLISADEEKKQTPGVLQSNYSSEDLINLFKLGDTVSYADGEIFFDYRGQKYDQTILIEAKTDGVMEPGKAIVNLTTPYDYGHSTLDYTECIELLEPKSIALSFVQSSEDVIAVKNSICEKVVPEIFSKIETKIGIFNSKKILEVSNVMLARGDLLMNCNPNEFYHLEKKFFECRKSKSENKVALATGVLESMRWKPIPSQADLIDLGIIGEYNPHYIIINYGLMKSQHLKNAINIVKEE